MPEPARDRRVATASPPATPGELSAGARSWGQGKAGWAIAIVLAVVAADYFTKQLVLRIFHQYEQVDVVGQYLRFTFIENTGAAFGIHVGGGYDRVVFLVLSAIALCALAAIYWATPARDRLRLFALALLAGGAIGNLIDRVRSARGVIDFIDIGIGNLRWPIFNLADLAITTGAVLLALSLLGEERRGGAPAP